MPVEIRQTASRPRSRSEIFCSGLPRAQSTKESIETYPGRGGESRSSRRSNASNSIASNSSETAQNDRCGGGGTTSEQDALKDLQERYNIDAVPTVQQYRVAGKAAGYRITADLMKPRNERPYVSFGVKLKNDAAVVKKVVVTPQFTDFRFFTRALEFGVLQLQLSLGFDWNKKIFGASWRCKTKWTKGSKIQKKFEILSRDHMELHTFWNIRQEFPQCGGKLSAKSSSFSQDLGRLQLDLHRLKATINL